MDMARKDAKEGETDVDEEIGAAACDEEDADWRDWKRELLADDRVKRKWS